MSAEIHTDSARYFQGKRAGVIDAAIKPTSENHDRSVLPKVGAKYRLEILSADTPAPQLFAAALMSLHDPEPREEGIWGKYMQGGLDGKRQERLHTKMRKVASSLATVYLGGTQAETDSMGIPHEMYAVSIAKQLLSKHKELATDFLEEYSRVWVENRYEDETAEERANKGYRKYMRLRSQLTHHEMAEEVML